MKDPERWLELGLLTLVGALLAAGGVAVGGGVAQAVARRRRNALPPPDPASTLGHAHCNISGASAR
ncbi:MAG TPA: hypothetical protein VIT43_14340 [Candidatus Dormibacteraeota bacterium]